MGTRVGGGLNVMGNGYSSWFLSVRMSNSQCLGNDQMELCKCVSIIMGSLIITGLIFSHRVLLGHKELRGHQGSLDPRSV